MWLFVLLIRNFAPHATRNRAACATSWRIAPAVVGKIQAGPSSPIGQSANERSSATDAMAACRRARRFRRGRARLRRGVRRTAQARFAPAWPLRRQRDTDADGTGQRGVPETLRGRARHAGRPQAFFQSRRARDASDHRRLRARTPRSEARRRSGAHPDRRRKRRRQPSRRRAGTGDRPGSARAGTAGCGPGANPDLVCIRRAFLGTNRRTAGGLHAHGPARSVGRAQLSAASAQSADMSEDVAPLFAPEHWRKVRAALDRLDALPTGERAGEIQALQAEDSELAATVLALLADTPADATLRIAGGVAPAATSPPRSQIGPFRLSRQLGSGGMGCVFLAERQGADFTQRVALKLLDVGGPNVTRLIARE